MSARDRCPRSRRSARSRRSVPARAPRSCSASAPSKSNTLRWNPADIAVARASSGSTPYLRPNWRASSKTVAASRVSADAPEAQPEVRQGIHDEASCRETTGRSRPPGHRERLPRSLGRQDRGERPHDMSDRLWPLPARATAAASISIAPPRSPRPDGSGQPRDRVGGEIRAMHPFGQFQRLRGKRLDHGSIEQEERSGPPARAGVRSVVRSAADRDAEAPARFPPSGAPIVRERRTRARAAHEGRMRRASAFGPGGLNSSDWSAMS